MACIVLAADLNVFALSDTIFCGKPLLAVNLLKHWMKASAVIYGTMFKCTALVIQQVNRQIQTLLFTVIPWSLMYSGPARSTPVCENVGASLTLNSWRLAFIVHRPYTQHSYIPWSHILSFKVCTRDTRTYHGHHILPFTHTYHHLLPVWG